MANSNQKGRNNNNPTGRNQYSGGLMDTVRNNPLKSAAAAAGAAAAGLFLWTRRDKIGEQASRMNEKLGEQASRMNEKVGEWREGRSAGSGRSSAPMGAETRNSGSLAETPATSSASKAKAVGSHAGKAQPNQASKAPEVSY